VPARSTDFASSIRYGDSQQVTSPYAGNWRRSRLRLPPQPRDLGAVPISPSRLRSSGRRRSPKSSILCVPTGYTGPKVAQFEAEVRAASRPRGRRGQLVHGCPPHACWRTESARATKSSRRRSRSRHRQLVEQLCPPYSSMWSGTRSRSIPHGSRRDHGAHPPSSRCITPAIRPTWIDSRIGARPSPPGA